MVMTIVKFGKYRGRNIEDVSDSYLTWIIDAKQKELTEFQNEFNRRHPQPANKPTAMSKVPQNSESGGPFIIFTNETLKQFTSQLADRCVARAIVPFVQELNEEMKVDRNRTYRRDEIVNRLFSKSSTYLTLLRNECIPQ